MSIFLSNIEMPTAGMCKTITIFDDGAVVDGNGSEKLGTAVPVPPHGDLIERKAICLTDFEIAMCGGDYKEGMKMLLEKTESAPTIIPAEEGE